MKYIIAQIDTGCGPFETFDEARIYASKMVLQTGQEVHIGPSGWIVEAEAKTCISVLDDEVDELHVKGMDKAKRAKL